MEPRMASDSSGTIHLLRRAADGDRESWGAALTQHKARLLRMVAFRMDPRLQGRIDPADVLQEVFLEASEQRGDYLNRRPMPLFLWLRGIATNKLLELHRHHLATQMRDARREVSLHRGPYQEVTAAALAAGLLGRLTRASEAAI